MKKLLKRSLYTLLTIFALTFIALVIHHHFIRPPTFKSTTKLSYYRYPDRWNHGSNDISGLTRAIDADLFNAVIEDNLALAQQLITQGANVNERVDHEQPHAGYTPLKIAIDNNSLAMAQLLIDAGANVNEPTDTSGIADEFNKHPTNDARNNTLLAWSIILNRTEMVKLLLQHGADVNAPDPIFKRWTPLMIARYNKRDEIATILLMAGAKY